MEVMLICTTIISSHWIIDMFNKIIKKFKKNTTEISNLSPMITMKLSLAMLFSKILPSLRFELNHNFRIIMTLARKHNLSTDVIYDLLLNDGTRKPTSYITEIRDIDSDLVPRNIRSDIDKQFEMVLLEICRDITIGKFESIDDYLELAIYK